MSTPKSKSCIGCKFLYSVGTGYSNWTWLDNEINCAKDANPNLPALEGYDWTKDQDNDNWPLTNSSRCELFSPGPFVALDVDGYDGPGDFTEDAEAIEAINSHSGRPYRSEV